ncbi:MAG TPA: hypothetical protein VLT90_02010 [Terriglobales bacterium]|nr:hypothetical protein [Terriglobales bacterium]
MIMRTMRTIPAIVMVLGFSLWTSAQDDSGRKAPVSPLGDNSPILNPDNPPVSGVDEAGLDLRSGERSFLSYGLSMSETVDSNAGNELDRQAMSSITHLLGAVDLQRLYSKTDLFAEYLGGGAFYSNATTTARQLHAAGVMGVMRWRTGRLTLRDSFSYLPEGSFSIGAFGGVPGLGIATGSGDTGLVGGLPGSHFFGNGQFGSVGLTPRISNSALASVVQALTPRSAVTVAVGFANAHFFDNTDVLINSDRTLVEAGYSYMLGRRDQLGVVYGFQQFRFPQDAGGQVDTHIINLRWGHTISGKMNLSLGAGPQYIVFEDPFLGTVHRWSTSGRAVLRYRFTRTSLALTYEKLTTAGSGFFAGSDTQAVRAGITRPLMRTWELYTDIGYAHNRRLQTQSLEGIPGNTFDHGFARLLLRRHLGREWSAFASYRFNDLALNNAFCDKATGTCGENSRRHMGSIGLEWHPRPIRID